MGDVVSSIDGMRPSKVLSYISEIAHHAVDEQYRILNDEICLHWRSKTFAI